MPRQSFYAPLGNPVNPRRMPSTSGMEFAQAIRPANPDSNDDGTVRHVIRLTLSSAAMSFVIPRVLSWVIWPQGRALLALAICAIVFTTLYLVALTGMFAGRKILSFRTFDTHIFMLATCGAVVLAFQIDGWHVLLVAATLLVIHSCLVMRHYVHHESAAPCDKAAASVMRDDIGTRILLVAMASAALGCGPFLLSGVPVWSGVAHLVSLLVLGLALAVGARRWWAVFRLWLTYDLNNSPAAGVWKSPSGSTDVRTATTYVTCLAFAIMIYRYGLSDADGLYRLSGVDGGIVLWLLSQIFPDIQSAQTLIVSGHSIWSWTLPTFLFLGTLAIPVLVFDKEISRFRDRHASTYHRYVETLPGSCNPTEASSIYLGQVAADDTPLFIPRSMTQSHWMFLGATESGKTTTLLRYAELVLDNYSDCSMVCVDCKAADNLYPESVKTAGRSVAHFTTSTGRSTHVFNPFGQLFWRQSAILDRATYLCDSLGLSYGTDYGKGWFASAIAVLCLKAVESDLNITNLNRLKDLVLARMDDRTIPKKTRADAPGIWNKLLMLGCLDMLNSTEKPTADVRELFDKPTVWSFHLPALGGAGPWNAEVARMLLYAILSEAQRRGAANRKRQIYIVMEEFPTLVSRNMERVFEQARSMNISLILSAQGLSNLRTEHTDLAAIINQNTRVRWYFGLRDKELIRDTSYMSGEGVESFGSVTTKGWERSYTQREAVVPRMNVNEIRGMTDDPHMSLIDIAQGDGFAQYSGLPFFLRTEYHISLHERQRRENAPSPEAGPNTITNSNMPQRQDPQPEPPKPADIEHPDTRRRTRRNR